MFTSTSKGNYEVFLFFISILYLICNLKCQSRVQAQKELTSLAISQFPMPGDGDFPLNGMFTKPTHDEAGSTFVDFKQNT